MKQEVNSKLRRIVNERSLEGVNPGDLVKVSLFWPTFNWRVYEGIVNGNDAFMERDLKDTGEYPKILSWRSNRKYLQFSDEEVPPFRKGVVFSHLSRDLIVYTPKFHPGIYPDKLKMIKQWENQQ